MSEKTLLPAEIPKGPIQVAVDLGVEAEIPTDSEAMAAMQRQGFTNLNKTTLRDLGTIGAYIHGVGTVRIQRGRVMVSQQRLDTAMRQVAGELSKQIGSKSKRPTRINDICRLGQVLGYMTARQVDAVKLMLQLEGGASAVEPGAPVDGLVPGFAPGSEVKANQTVVFAREAHMYPPSTAK